MDQITRLSFNLTTREIEIEGSESFVREYFEKYKDIIDTQLKNSSPSNTSSEVRKKEEILPSDYEFPSSFGEYLHTFKSPLKHVDEILIAGYFVQKNSEDKAFTTEAANKLLIEQGIKLANAADSVNSNKGSKRIFVKTKGVFQVSKTGEEYIASLTQK